jgi:hypothetical protein
MYFFGLFGIHNFYLGRPKLALFQLLGGGVALLIVLIGGGSGNGGVGALGIVILVAWGLSFIGDLFFIPGRARKHAEALRMRVSQELSSAR